METDYNNIPAGTETDRLVAEKVMGWTWDKYKRVYRINPNDNSLFGTGWGDDESPNGYFEPSTDIKAAWEVMDKLNERGFDVNITISESIATVSVCHKAWITDNLYQSVALPTAKGTTPLAICRVALLAIG